MAISDYTELLIEAAERAGDSSLPTRGKMLVGFLEDYLNKKLRVSNMEGSQTSTANASGEVTLPTGWIELKGVYHDDIRIPRMTYDIVEQDFTNWGYYTDGDTLKSNLEGKEITVLYYSAIDGLHDNSTNFLLTAEPEIYLTGLVWQSAVRMNEFEKATAAKGYLDLLLAEYQKQDDRKRRGLTEVDMAGEVYVRGSNFTVTP